MTSASRRDFLKSIALAAGASGMAELLCSSIQSAAAIEPVPGSSFLDAEHIVILMQENRSFDHMFGTLQGVRGYDDPRAITLPSGDPVWVQTNSRGQSYSPFHLDIQHTRATWMGCLPHNWTDQVDARNAGRYDRWLDTKASGEPAFADMPLTLGYYNRQDVPFYYALADAFTICDQNFCSSLTGTTPNRLYLWSGTIRHEPHASSHAKVLNSDADHATEVSWRTFPELLEAEGISWKVYQNELYLDVGLGPDKGPWLDNFGDNPLEYFSQFQVRFAPSYLAHLAALAESLPREKEELSRQLASTTVATEDRATLATRLQEVERRIEWLQSERATYNEENRALWTQRQRELHERAFCCNVEDPNFHDLETLHYRDGATERTVSIPKGDVLHQFRKDVAAGTLPTVSWVVAPERFSDHPCSPWYGAWYLAECFNILTQNPAVWKKTIFILTYDENDGYFDHVPPFVAPDPRRPETGRVSADIDSSVEYVTREEELKHKPAGEARDSSIGLGYRVPMIIASPWSRGGRVCSQVFDHTSPIQLVERILSHQLGREIRENNISQWRRSVCGDLTSAFQAAPIAEDGAVAYEAREPFIAGIHKAQFAQTPAGFQPLTTSQLAEARRDPRRTALRPRQEPGSRMSCPLPYELHVDGQLTEERTHVMLRFAARRDRFGIQASGAPFVAYYRDRDGIVQTRNYAVSPGHIVEDRWSLQDFVDGRYDLQVYGPNGFYRRFCGDREDPPVRVTLSAHGDERPELAAASATPWIARVRVTPYGQMHGCRLLLRSHAYDHGDRRLDMVGAEHVHADIDVASSHGWYDCALHAEDFPHFARWFAGRAEVGAWSRTDPQIGSA